MCAHTFTVLGGSVRVSTSHTLKHSCFNRRAVRGKPAMCIRRGCCWGGEILHRGWRKRKEQLFSSACVGCTLLLRLDLAPRYGGTASCSWWSHCVVRSEGWWSLWEKREIWGQQKLLWKLAAERSAAHRRGGRCPGASVGQCPVLPAQSSQPCRQSPPSTGTLTPAPKPKQSLNLYLNRKASRFLDRTDCVATNLRLQFQKQTSVWHVPHSSVGHQWLHP